MPRTPTLAAVTVMLASLGWQWMEQGDARAGTLVTVSYLAREGRPLPMLEHP